MYIYTHLFTYNINITYDVRPHVEILDAERVLRSLFLEIT